MSNGFTQIGWVRRNGDLVSFCEGKERPGPEWVAAGAYIEPRPITGTVFALGGDQPEPPPEGKLWALIAVPIPEGRALPLYGSVRIFVGGDDESA